MYNSGSGSIVTLKFLDLFGDITVQRKSRIGEKGLTKMAIEKIAYSSSEYTLTIKNSSW